MTDKEKILALEIENARYKAALGYYAATAGGPWGGDSYKTTICSADIETFAVGPVIMPFGGRQAREALAAQPPSDVMGKLDKVRKLVEWYQDAKWIPEGSEECFSISDKAYEALAILKELGVE